MAASPVVDGIEGRHAGQLIVVRLNVQDASAPPWLARFGFLATPTFVFFDASGQEMWRSMGSIEPERVAECLANPSCAG
jgi:thioredoxin-related protein